MRFFSHSADKSKDATLLKELSQAKQEMEDAYANFQNVSDPDLIDCYIYRSHAAWKRYLFLLRLARGKSHLL